MVTAEAHTPQATGHRRHAPLVEIVVPVYNEHAVLATSIRRLHSYLSEEFPFSWRIVIADNASTDDTLAIAQGLAEALPGVDVLHLAQKGRGRALRAAWSTSESDIVAYMDVDLSTDLRALLPLVAPLLSGHSDLAIGTRLAHGAHVSRSTKREFISRSYNLFVKCVLLTHFSDAQCGFKAVSRRVVREIVPQVKDEAWFFDTELLTLAEKQGFRVFDQPVEWVDDDDSRVKIVSTAWEDIKGVLRVRGYLWSAKHRACVRKLRAEVG